MKIQKLILAAAIVALAACTTENGTQTVIEKPQVKVEDGRFTPELMWQLGQLTEYAISPSGEKVVYGVKYIDMQQNKGNVELYVMSTTGGEPSRLTVTAASEFSPVWLDDNTILFCRDNSIMMIGADGKGEQVVGEWERGFEGFKLSPDKTLIAYISTIPVEHPEHISSLYRGLDKTTGRINEDLMYRHWDQWVDEIPHIYVAPFDGKKMDVSRAVDMLEGEPYEAPMRPFGGTEQYCFSPDSKKLAYTCRKKTGYEYAHSTNSDIYVYDIESRTDMNISEGIMGYDQNPVFSPDGSMIAWESMERDGYESDKSRLMLMDIATGIRTDLTTNFDYSVGNLCWSEDGRQIVAIVPYRGMYEVFAFAKDGSTIRQLSHGYHDVNGIILKGNDIYAKQVSMQYPPEIYHYALNDDKSAGKKLTTINDEVLAQVRMGKVEEYWIKTVDGKEMLTWLIYPYNSDSTKTYPALLFCEGGPQSMVSQFWSTRWNFAVMSGAEYFVIAPNRRGCPGFGTDWCEQISGDYGGLCMKDYMTATDFFKQNCKYIDPERVGACGASFGGYSIYWLAGHNEDHRFKAFLAHNGMFNFEQQYLETEEMWFDNWDIGGPYWDKCKPQVVKSYAQTPHLFVDKWTTPICVVHSEQDFRIVASEGMAAYNAAQMQHIPSRYLYFPDECHWVLKPQNSLLWHRNFIDWFDKWLKNNK